MNSDTLAFHHHYGENQWGGGGGGADVAAVSALADPFGCCRKSDKANGLRAYKSFR